MIYDHKSIFIYVDYILILSTSLLLYGFLNCFVDRFYVQLTCYIFIHNYLLVILDFCKITYLITFFFSVKTNRNINLKQHRVSQNKLSKLIMHISSYSFIKNVSPISWIQEKTLYIELRQWTLKIVFFTDQWSLTNDEPKCSNTASCVEQMCY